MAGEHTGKERGRTKRGKGKRLQSPAWLFMIHEEVNLRVFIHQRIGPAMVYQK
jgi:hypothetical protein